MRTFRNRYNIVHCLIMAMLLLCSCQKELHYEEPAADHNLTIQFKPIVDADSLEFGKTYQNYSGEDYTIRNFKFYICQVDLINTSTGNSYRLNKDDYFLVNFADQNSIKLSLKAASSSYNKIAFTIGVDSIRNVSGAQTGALDPANGMFWTWNSGYIMAKLEGNSPISNQPNEVFEYHIGGFSGPDDVVQKITLSFPSNTTLDFAKGRSTHMTITANANTWFDGDIPLTIAALPVCTTPGTLARFVASKYANMFEVINIVSE